jgi:hypothetical protein
VSRSQNPIEITLLEKGGEAEWATFLETADRATLFHDLRFLAYHPHGRFRFAQPIAAIPGGLVGADDRPTFVSPLGASIGGPAVSPDLNTDGLLELVAALLDHARAQSWAGIEMVLPPALYHALPSDGVEFALFFHGFHLVNRQLCPIIPIAAGTTGRYAHLFRSRFTTRVRAGLRDGVRVVNGGLELLEDFLVVFDDTYVKATHDATEIADLLRRLPERVQLHVAFAKDVPVAGLLVFLLNARVAYSFYICTSSEHAREPGGVVVFASLIDSLGAAGYRWLDLGPTARPGNFNAGVTQFKEGLGGVGHCRDRWFWSAEDSVP